jgi:hypothetical protein
VEEAYDVIAKFGWKPGHSKPLSRRSQLGKEDRCEGVKEIRETGGERSNVQGSGRLRWEFADAIERLRDSLLDLDMPSSTRSYANDALNVDRSVVNFVTGDQYNVTNHYGARRVRALHLFSPHNKSNARV